ncbi:phosphoesterase, partial [Xanthomonas sp. Kuri4-2]
MEASVRQVLAGETVELLGDRALYRPARRALLIADLHLGKADVFRRAGIGLPAGGTGH